MTPCLYRYELYFSLKIFPKLGNLVFLEKVQKMSESTNIPIPYTPNNDSIRAKTNWIFYLDISANKQNKNHVHPNDTKPIKDDL